MAAWDDDAGRGRPRAADLGVAFHDDLAELLARDDVDGVIVTTRTNAHPEVITAAAKAGKHVFTEKVLALTPADARAIVDAVDANGVKLTVSLPRLAHGYTIAIRDVLASGRLGEVTQVRCRLSHDGAVGPRWLPAQFFDPVEAGGGALADLGCHPLYLTRLFLGGMPESVSAAYGHVTGRAVEDNAVVILRRSTGALGIAETGFVNPRSPFSIEVHGTRGSLLYGTPEARLLVQRHEADRDEWTEIPIPRFGAVAVPAMGGPHRRRHDARPRTSRCARPHGAGRRGKSIGAHGQGGGPRRGTRRRGGRPRQRWMTADG